MVISTAPYVNNPTCPPSQVREPEHGDQHCALREQPDLSPLQVREPEHGDQHCALREQPDLSPLPGA